VFWGHRAPKTPPGFGGIEPQSAAGFFSDASNPHRNRRAHCLSSFAVLRVTHEMSIAREHIDSDADKILRRLRRNGHTAYLVGGCVRDLLLGRTPKDFDIATSATPQEIKDLFRNSRIIGRRFRLAHIFFGSKIIETSTFRANPREGVEPEEGEEIL